MRYSIGPNSTRVAISVAVGFLVASSSAIVPDEQFVPKTILEPVVRIHVWDEEPNVFAGSGSVIHKMDDPHDPQSFLLCVLTANHVVDGRHGITIGFNNLNNPHGNLYPAWIVAEGKNKAFGSWPNVQHPDLAILGVKAPRNAFLNALVPLDVVDDTSYNPGREFTVVGYGRTGSLRDLDGDGVPDGYEEFPGTGGNKRFANNKFDHKIKHGWTNARTGSIYNHEAWEYDLTGPAPGVDGEGFPLRGDSGGPLLVENQVGIQIRTHPPRVINAHTRSIVGVVSWGAYHQGVYVRWGLEKEYDVRITPAYRQWIMHECQNVPEPSTIVALMTATILFAARRKRARV